MNIHCRTCNKDLSIGYSQIIRWDSLDERCQKAFLPISFPVCVTFTNLEVRRYLLPVWSEQYHLLENHELELVP